MSPKHFVHALLKHLQIHIVMICLPDSLPYGNYNLPEDRKWVLVISLASAPDIVPGADLELGKCMQNE